MSTVATKRVKITHPGTTAKSARTRRGLRTVSQCKRLKKVRLRVYKTSTHTYAQVIDPSGDIIVAASTVEKSFRRKHGGNMAAATWVGEKIAERAMAKGTKSLSFDRAGYVYHGRIKALADAAREQGLQF